MDSDHECSGINQMLTAPEKGAFFIPKIQSNGKEIIMKHYFSSLFFTVIAIVATIATIATGENNFLCTVVFGTFAVGDAWNTTKTLRKRYKAETNYRGKHSRAA